MKTNHIILAHVIDGLKELPDDSVDMVVSSPPYWGLRKYMPDSLAPWWGGDANCQHENFWEYPKRGVSGGKASKKVQIKGRENYQIVPDAMVIECKDCCAIRCEHGQEPVPDIYIKNELAIWRECARVLKPEGTLWVNIGDTYAGSGGRGRQYSKNVPAYKQHKIDIKSKSLIGIPARLQAAMIDDGWICRNEIVWKKNQAIPQPHKDKLSPSHEMIYVFSGKFQLYAQQRKYYFDQLTEPRVTIGGEGIKFGGNKAAGYGNALYSGNQYKGGNSRNMRDVWFIDGGPTVWEFNTANFKGNHFAVFPLELPRRAIAAGSKPGGIVLDPFMGSGTTAIAAEQLGRKWIGIEMFEDNKKLALERIASTVPKVDREDGLLDI